MQNRTAAVRFGQQPSGLLASMYPLWVYTNIRTLLATGGSGLLLSLLACDF